MSVLAFSREVQSKLFFGLDIEVSSRKRADFSGSLSRMLLITTTSSTLSSSLKYFRKSVLVKVFNIVFLFSLWKLFLNCSVSLEAFDFLLNATK